jgi:hypothetical protein
MLRMTESSQHPLPPAGRAADGYVPPAAGRPGLPALLVTLAIAVGGAVLGVVGGYVWAAIAPKALFVESSHGVAFVVNAETSAFIAADGWFGLVGAVGGLIIGLAAYFLGVRRFGPLPAAGALIGATAAAFLAWWIGRNVGLASFRHLLGTSKPGTLLRQPPDLGAHGALAFWPLVAGAVILIIELVRSMRDRRPRSAGGRQPLPAPPVTSQPASPPPPPLSVESQQYRDQYGGPGQYGPR